MTNLEQFECNFLLLRDAESDENNLRLCIGNATDQVGSCKVGLQLRSGYRFRKNYVCPPAFIRNCLRDSFRSIFFSSNQSDSVAFPE